MSYPDPLDRTSSDARERVLLFDTTLRDGEQAPGAAMTLHEKLRIAEALQALGVDIIEAGFPVTSNGDFEAVQEISKVVREPVIAALGRMVRRDIDRTVAALRPARRGRLNVVIALSPLHMRHKLQMEPEDVLEAVRDCISYARNLIDDIEFSGEDSTRAEPDFLCRVLETAIDAGLSTFNVCDTVGYALPEEYAALIRTLLNRVPNIDKCRLSTHCHNDLGLGVANTLAGLKAGARQIECTVNGLGERAGNAALEEVVMAMRTRPDLLPYATGVKTQEITRVSRLVSAVTGFAVQKNKSVVGANAFAHESGIHQDGMLKNARTYEIMTPESVGLAEFRLTLGKLSGRHAFKSKLKELGFGGLDDVAVDDAFRRFKELADRKRDVLEEELVALVGGNGAPPVERLRFAGLRAVCGTTGPQTAEVELEIDGTVQTAKATGKGPVDATVNAIRALFPHRAVLELLQVHAAAQGSDAAVEVTVRLQDEGQAVNGQGADVDTLVASAKAYVHALNKLLTRRNGTGASSGTVAALAI